MRYALLLLLVAVPAQAAIEFNRDIRPILSENCFACHGPDTAKRKASLRLDTAAGTKESIVAGKPEESELYRRVAGLGDGKRMPPASTNKTLTKAQADLIRRWIAEGGKYDAHWSFIAPKRPALPAVKDTRWGKTPIDRFILATLEREGVRPGAEADRRTLIRRLSFDLRGLPPSPEEVDAYVADTSEKAYENLVEKMLTSKHHGERLALFWLDLVRFADTAGYHSDNFRDVYLYRDWVIDAFNANKRFDRFTIEQIAGDLLPTPTRSQKIASGYNRLLMTTEEGGAQAKEYLAKYAADRVRNSSVVWMGLTMGCAECHSHKYDPITAKEFYQYASFWADIQETPVGRQAQTKIPSVEQEIERANLEAELAAARKSLATPTPSIRAAQALWEKTTVADLGAMKSAWTAIKPTKVASSGGSTLTIQGDRSVLTSGKNPDKDTYTVALATDEKAITGLRLAALRHPSFSGLSRNNGNFVLTGIEVAVLSKDGKRHKVALARAEADYSQPGHPVASLVGKGNSGWAIEGHVRKDADRQAMFAFAKPITGGPGTTIEVRLVHASPYVGHNIGRFRLDLTTVPAPGLGDKGGLPAAVLAALQVPADKRTDAHKATLTAHYSTLSPESMPTRAKIAKIEARLKQIADSAPQTLISSAAGPRMMRVLPRGNWLDDTGEIVAPGVPASLPRLSPAGKRATRLDLAKWLVSPEHPLTARVFVNRLWKLLYGNGLVTSLEDFGSQGNPPSHPELLDWLAVEFRESGWDVRHLLRLMVTSSAYRQVSTAGEAVRGRDPYNHLVARQARFRLDAEVVRDNALAVSGLLTTKVGGPSVKPYQPAGYWEYLNFPTRTYAADRGDDQYRRGVYTYWQRSFPHPSLTAFDAPSREECTAERPRSNTPQQALVLLNDPTYVEAARVLAAKILRDGGKGDADRLAFAFRQVLGRKPRPAEAELLLALLARHRRDYQADKEAAEGLLAIGQTPVGKDVDRQALASWTSITRVLLNLHETITRE
jgi:Protein of unknown function (DUF1553)/Protein of unknown function (DUF1549)/Planctomycete cytochrome C